MPIKYDRRLSDKIIIAHDLACKEGKADVAEHLIRALEADLSYGDDDEPFRREQTAYIEEAYERHTALVGGKDGKS